jgi:hypothetical protein
LLTNDRKEWKADAKKTQDGKRYCFTKVLSKLSEFSRCEIQDDEDWEESFAQSDLLYLIRRIRATHIARQSGNPAQDIYGLPAAYQQGHGTQRSLVGPREDEPIPLNESVEQELQVDLFFFLGHVFLLSMGLIMVTQLGPESNADGPDRTGESMSSSL